MPPTDSSRLQKLWLAVETKPEHTTTEFWDYVLRLKDFPGSQSSLPSQQPPMDDANHLRRVDLLVRTSR
ncbi:hypothetical protein MAJ_11313, partial [Metarhizium majus ARSEF 297]